jgi:hypothetical protein
MRTILSVCLFFAAAAAAAALTAPPGAICETHSAFSFDLHMLTSSQFLKVSRKAKGDG